MAQISSKMNENKQLCSLTFNEVSIKPHLYVHQNLHTVQGLEDFGFCRTKNISDHVLVYLLRVINFKWKQPVTYYYVKSGMKTYNLKISLEKSLRQYIIKLLFKYYVQYVIKLVLI